MAILLGDNTKKLLEFNNDCIDLVITSPPYDDLREYGDKANFDYKKLGVELYRVMKEGAVMVWIVGDASIDGQETGSSMRQAIYFKDIGFRLHDTMIWSKKNWRYPAEKSKRYNQMWEFMFILTKGTPKTFNPIKDYPVKKWNMKKYSFSNRKGDKLEQKKVNIKYGNYAMRPNIWEISTGFLVSTKDEIAYDHPAIFPDQLAEDHIKSWSNPGDFVLDPFLGSGTVYKAALKLNRRPIGIEINEEYLGIIKKRCTSIANQQRLDDLFGYCEQVAVL